MNSCPVSTGNIPPHVIHPQSSMKVLLVAFLVGAASAFVERAEWEAFKQKHAKSYVNPIEEFYRMKVSLLSEVGR